MFFKHLEISKWQQFEEVSIDFHNKVTILTGANGSGKTTLLSMLARHEGWQYVTLGTPRTDRVTGLIKFIARLFNGEDRSNETSIGHLEYSNGVRSSLVIEPQPGSAQYSFNIANQQGLKCFFIPSHRPVFRYQPVGQIPTAKKDKQTAFNEVVATSRQQYFGGGGHSHSWYMKNILIGWAILGYGVKSGYKTIMPPDIEQVRFYEGFQEILSKVLPKSLGFRELEIRNMEVVFVCNDGRDEFLLETVSGGVTTLIDLAWRIYMYSTKENSEGFTVLIDEMENHLHPSMQRVVLNDFLAAFPAVRFVVSTHSPLIVGSVRDSSVYALRYNSAGKIVSQNLDLRQKAKSATEVLDEVLGVSASMPVWAEEELSQILRRFKDRPVSKESFRQLRTDLTSAGLDGLVPEAIGRAVDEHDKSP